jgi:hypothetical protein
LLIKLSPKGIEDVVVFASLLPRVAKVFLLVFVLLPLDIAKTIALPEIVVVTSKKGIIIISLLKLDVFKLELDVVKLKLNVVKLKLDVAKLKLDVAKLKLVTPVGVKVKNLVRIRVLT